MADDTWRDGTQDDRTLAALEALLAPVGALMGERNRDRVESTPHELVGGAGTTLTTAGQAIWGHFTAPWPGPTVPLTKLGHYMGVAATGGSYHCRLGIFTVAADESVTCIARTADDANLIQGAAGRKLAALDPTGGYAASWTPIPGNRYAFCYWSTQATTPANIMYRGLRPEVNISPGGMRRIVGASTAGQVDMPTSGVFGTYVYGMPYIWAEP